MNAFRLSNIAWQINEYGFPQHSSGYEKLKFLLNYAVLAPSLHNTQPWKFTVRGNEIHVLADTMRWLKVADPDQRELFISIGCALENLLVAANHFGYRYEITYFPDVNERLWVATIRFTETNKPAALADRELFYALGLRHTHRQLYAPTPLAERDLQRLQDCAHEPDLALQFVNAPIIKEQVDTLTITADVTQFADPAYCDELNNWIEQGAFGHRWLVSRMGQLATAFLNTTTREGEQRPSAIISSPTLGLISSGADNPEARVRVGQVFERLALNATAMNIAIQPITQILQVAFLKPEVVRLFEAQEPHPQFAFRLGYANLGQDSTTRQPLDAVVKS